MSVHVYVGKQQLNLLSLVVTHLQDTVQIAGVAQVVEPHKRHQVLPPLAGQEKTR